MKLKIIIPVLACSFLFSGVPENNLAKTDEAVRLPVIMYHSVTEKEKTSSDYIVSTKQLESDIIYLKNKGYTPVTCLDLIKYTVSDFPIPQKPVLLTFDDGMLNNMTLALPILEKYGFSALFSIVGSYADEYSTNGIKNNDYSYLTWQDIYNLSNNKSIELGNHSYNMHSINGRFGSSRRKNETFSDYLQFFTQDTQKMQQEFFSYCTLSPVIYTYPFGEFCKDSERILKKNGFLVTFSCIEGINKITKNPECLYLLKRYNRSGKMTTEEFFSKLKL